MRKTLLAPSIGGMTSSLTERERTILEMLAGGYSDPSAIAKHLDSDARAVALALESAQEKLGAMDACHAIAIAIREGHIL